MDVDFCRALAAGLFPIKDAMDQIDFVEFSSSRDGLELLANGEVDLCAGIPYTLSHYAKKPGFSFSRFLWIFERARQLCTGNPTGRY